MLDKIFGEIEDKKCPKCGKKKVICVIQYPLIVKVDMESKPIFRDFKGKRKRPSNRDMAMRFLSAMRDEFECANYTCEACGWTSETYTP